MLCFDLLFIISLLPTGLGRTAPDPSDAVNLDGVQVPLGKGVHTNIDDTSLLYNEYPLTVTTWFMNLIFILLKTELLFLCFQFYSINTDQELKSSPAQTLLFTLKGHHLLSSWIYWIY